MISKRASSWSVTLNQQTHLYSKLNNMYAKDNPGGIVDLGTVDNQVMEDVAHQKMAQILNQETQSMKQYLNYQPFDGLPILKEAIASFWNSTILNQPYLSSNHVVITNGVSSAVEVLLLTLADPGDVFLVFAPYFWGFQRMLVYSGVELIGIPVDWKHGAFCPTLKEMENVYERITKKQGKRVKGLLLCHPHNPFGICYSLDELQRIVSFCIARELHIVSDEIYALSQWSSSQEKPFHSLLNVAATTETIHWQSSSLVHVVWGMTKDFGLSGIRVGAVLSRNRDVLAAVKTVSVLHSTDNVAQFASACLLQDTHFLRGYLSLLHHRLFQNYCLLSSFFQKNGVEYIPAQAGCVLWVNLTPLLPSWNDQKGKEQAELKLWEALIHVGVYVSPGSRYCDSEGCGWFRFVFCQPKEVLELALTRMAPIFQQYRPSALHVVSRL